MCMSDVTLLLVIGRVFPRNISGGLHARKPGDGFPSAPTLRVKVEVVRVSRGAGKGWNPMHMMEGKTFVRRKKTFSGGD